jgi:hypothetical protein
MTKHLTSDAAVFLEAYDFEDAETDISGLLKGLPSFPGAQHFNEIMHEKMRPKKVAKFKIPRRAESDF